ncbi:hypothetical protein FRC17_001527 [Serendipita sp. 399]|nr:hypothetical protein FRC17_001527 [Serendipita sp. 399]
MSAKKLQTKIFGGSSSSSSNLKPTPDTGLTINIPKPPETTPLTQSQTKSTQRTNGDAHSPAAAVQSYQNRLAAELKSEYESVERYRLLQDERKERHWKKWGPYLSERQWATVREDYSANGDAWSHFPHSQARSRAFRWGEDGLAGISDNRLSVCFSLALWNGVDPILKERLFGVTGHEGNHGEDVKELYYYLDSTPTHSYMKYLYKYPQRPYPYEQLVRENANRSRDVNEYEILDTDAFEDDRYWDVFVEYAKDEDTPNAISIRITAYNRGPDFATLHIIPQLLFPNTWSWSHPRLEKPGLQLVAPGAVAVKHPNIRTNLYCLPSPPPVGPDTSEDIEEDNVYPDMLFTENETNYERLYGGQNESAYAKDAFHDHIIPSHHPATKVGCEQPTRGLENGNGAQTGRTFVNPLNKGTKVGAHYTFRDVPPNGGCVVVRCKLTPAKPDEDAGITDEELFDTTVEERREEADEFYRNLAVGPLTDDIRSVMRQALAGMLWSKQYYKFIQTEWLAGDSAQPPPPPGRKYIRNREWKHLHIEDVLSMPDKWEYPFFAAWDTAFHCIPLAMVDPAFAKKQLDLLTREWYMKPDGQIPAYEWNFSDVNPPVHAWAVFRVFKIERKLHGKEDIKFLERVFQKLLLNFTWWVNRKDQGGHNVFEGGFLGLDNIGAFNRSEPLPTGGVLRQADGTAWMAFFCLNMLSMALELAKHNSVYEDIASKFFEHFIFIADAMTYKPDPDNELSLWNEEEGFYFDAIQWGNYAQQLPVRSLVGLIPLYATLVLEPSTINRFPGFKKRMEWFIENRPEMANRNMANMKGRGKGDRRLLALCDKDRLVKILERMLDEEEFFSDYGIRSLSLYHKDNPYSMTVHGQKYEVAYWPGDSKSGMFGGNSNWRGPIWLATNFLLIESLQRFSQYYGNDLEVECPTNSGDFMPLNKVAEEIQHRIIHIFARDIDGRRATNGGSTKLDRDPYFRDYVWFYEFFHGNDGRGLGASHQTGCHARHYFDEQLTMSEGGDPLATPYTPYTPYSAISPSPSMLHTLEDISPDAL